MHLLGYFRAHKAAVAVVLVLLIAQAFADLALPNLTSQIVDVGIQQSGVESVAVDEMTERTFELACALSPADDEALLRASYDRTDAGTWVLNGEGRAHRADLERILALPLVAAHAGDALPAGSLDQLMEAYRAGVVDKQRVLELADAARAQMGEASGLLDQQALAAARAEYEDAGYDLADLQMGFLLRTGGLMLGLAAASMALSVCVGLVAARTGARIGYELRSRLFTRVVSFSEGDIGKFSAASLITRGTNDVQLIQNVSVMLLRMVLSAPVLAVGGIVMVMTTNASMGWIIVVAILCVFAVIGVVFKVAMPKFKAMQRLIDRVNLVAREMLTGMPVIRAFDRQPYEEERFDEASARLMRTQLFTNRVMTFMMPAMMLIMNATSVAIVWVGGRYVDTGVIQTGDLIAFITYAMVIIMSFLMLGMVSIMLPRADVAAERVNEVLAAEPAVRDPEPARGEQAMARLEATAAARVASGGPRGAEIAFHDVSFAYADSDECVLESVSFTARPGQTLAIIGSTGSGKSTIVKLIERFYDATAGTVTVDGVDVRDLPQAALRAQLGYVPQKAFLFSGTIETNVAYADAAMGEERVERALACAQALGFVNEREDGVDAAVAQGGSNVSGGQRQRLAIARALAADARAYLFDDSFSALDYQTDAALRQAMAHDLGDVTQVIVAQRISSIRHADCIVVLDEGRVVGQGTHDELMTSCEEYREIAYSQLTAEELEGGDAA
ncbi:ABC transporter ATP-binding protein [Enterorhabdus sp. P55]|uniref:ABC transporter ATP-binding protein n=1 Tax=Enterorhabdus sp. P55 TaxID=2304571 RepID=UPI00136CBF5B|nr:ABC transporter ATP-binding protein [Enterorhabdus sp. P55]NBI31904.1 ABC transporter ATP-binding protein [Enterorhabdus sp. P55]